MVTQDARVWATLQGLISDYAIGPKAYDDVADKYVDSPQTPGEIALCHSQKMIKAGGFAYVALSIARPGTMAYHTLETLTSLALPSSRLFHALSCSLTTLY